MKFKKLKKSSIQYGDEINLLVGMKKGKTYLVAKKNSRLKWVVYYNVKPEITKKENFVRISELSSLDEVLIYFQSKELEPYYPEEQIIEVKKPNEIEISKNKKVNRRYYRKKVNLTGEYKNSRTGRAGELLIKDISLNGIKFSTIGVNGNQIGDKLHLTFTLDNSKKSVISREVQIKHVRNHDFGAEFISSPEYDKDLGFYLWVSH